MHDVSLPVRHLTAILEDYSEFVDVAKFGIGTAYVTPNLEAKLELYRGHGVTPYFGGTLFEKFYYQKKLDEYLEFLKTNGVELIEVSNGSVEIPLEERLSLVKELSSDFSVFAEVGSKDVDVIMAPSEWINEINRLHESGAAYVITEGRDSGTVGIFRPSGELRTGLVEDITKSCDFDRIIFEAPTPKAQMHFILNYGANVNLGNVNPNDLLVLETQRVGLRSETFYVTN